MPPLPPVPPHCPAVTQAPLHSSSPAGQPQAPCWQICPAPHCAQLAPQCNGSLDASRHWPAQKVCPGVVQLHEPALQAWPPMQLVPHAPQLVRLVMVSTHSVPQSVWPEGQPQLPFVHSRPAGQTVPQAPQLASSVASVTQAAPQAVVPGSHMALQAPIEQNWPPQLVPHVPQFAGSDCVSMQAPLQLVRPSTQVHAPP